MKDTDIRPANPGPSPPRAHTHNVFIQNSDGQAGQELRRQAEVIGREKTARLPENIKALSVEEAGHLIHELRVHQIELELQNQELKRTQEKLEASRNRYFNFYDHSPVGYFTLSEQGLILEVNLTAANLLGAPKDALVRQPLTRFIHPADQDIYYLHCKKQIATGAPQNCELRMIKKDDAPFWVRFESKAVQDIEGNPVIRIVMSDITELKLEQQALHQLAEAVNQASEAIAIVGTEDKIVYANPAFEQLTGYSSGEAIGQTPHIHKSGLYDETSYKQIWGTDLPGRRWAGRMINKHKDGTLYTADCSVTPVKSQEDHIVNFVWLMRDITLEVDIEKKIAQAQKMESIGSLAGGIAHDLNNILFPISGLSEMLLDDMRPDSSVHESAEQIYKAAQRGSDLVKQILAFSRQSSPRKLPLRIQPILKDVLKLVRVAIPKNIEITSHIRPDCSMVSADPTQVHQIIMNLIINAYHAVEGSSGGTIHIGLKEVDMASVGAKAELTFYAMQDLLVGRYAQISVTDTGMGMNQGLIDKIFIPYFTTKAPGKGTGLGLSVVHGIVKEHGGDIRVYSEVGKGTTFTVFLPLLEDVRDDKYAVVTGNNPTGCERILLVDDDEMVVRMEKKMLERLGYQVTARSCSPDALAVFSADPSKFDLVISDMGMSNMTGEQLARELISLKPGIPIIICTGFSDENDEKCAVTVGIKGFLKKPVTTSDFAKMIRKVLDDVSGCVPANASGLSGAISTAASEMPAETELKEKRND